MSCNAPMCKGIPCSVSRHLSRCGNDRLQDHLPDDEWVPSQAHWEGQVMDFLIDHPEHGAGILRATDLPSPYVTFVPDDGGQIIDLLATRDQITRWTNTRYERENSDV